MRTLALLAGCLWAMTPRVAVARAPTVTLTWSAPAECPDQVVFQAQVEAVLDQRLDEQTVLLMVHVELLLENNKWQARITTRADDKPPGERELGGDTCQAVSEAAALIVALAINPDAILSGAAPGTVPPTGDPRTDATTVAESDADTNPDDATATPSTTDAFALPTPETNEGEGQGQDVLRPNGLSFFVRTELGGDLGTLPTATAVGRLSAGLGWNVFRVEASAALFRPRRAYVDQANLIGGDIDLLVFGLRGCIAGTLFVCLGAETGPMHGQGFGVVPARNSTVRWTALIVAVGLSFKMSDLIRLTTSFEPTFGVEQPVFFVNQNELVHGPSQAARFFLGVEARFL